MLLSGGMGTAVAVILSPFIGNIAFGSEGTTLLVLTFLSGFLLDLTTLYGGYFLGAGMYAEAVLQNILYVPLSRGLGLALAFSGFRVEGIVIGWLLGGLATLLMSVNTWRGHHDSKDLYPIRRILAFSVPIFISSLVILLQGWSDIALLQAITGQFATIGGYYLVVTSVGFLSILWTPLVSALYPVLSLSHAINDINAVTQKLNQALRLSISITLPIGASLSVVAPTALSIVYGQTYAQQATALMILSLTTTLSSQGALLLAALQAVGKPRSVMAVVTIAFAIDVAVVVLTGRSFGTVGAALGRSLLSIATVSLSYLALRAKIRATPWQGLRKAIPLAVGVSVPLAAFGQLVHGVPPLLEIPILLGLFALCFAILARELNAFRPEDWEILIAGLPTRFRKHGAFAHRILTR